MAIKLMSWNVNKRVEKLPEQLKAIDSAGVDILALQEVSSNMVESLKEGFIKLDLNHVKLGISGDSHLVIASRWPAQTIKVIKAPHEESTLSATIKSPFGEIKIHTVHVPPARSSGRPTKIATFDSIYKALAKPSNRHRILCGDFNSPKEESSDGTAYWGPKYGQRSEKQVLKGLKEHDLEDTYRKLHPDYNDGEYSHVNRNPKTPNRRYDHILSSTSLNPKKCGYLHHCLKDDLSDHAPVYALYEPKILRLPIKPSGQ